MILPAGMESDMDSGVHTLSSVSSSVGAVDLHLNKSTFYNDPNSAESIHRKPTRSSFYAADTLLPPSNERTTGSKISSAFNKVSVFVTATNEADSEAVIGWFLCSDDAEDEAFYHQSNRRPG